MLKRQAAVWLVVLATAVPAAAQEKPLSLAVGGAVVGPLSASADRFSTGLGVTFGATWHINEQMGVKTDYVWSTLGVQDDWPVPRPSAPIQITPRIQFGTADFMFQAPPGRVRLYILAGVGLYRRSVTLATSGTGFVMVCDPWWFVCDPQPVPVERVAGSRSTTDVGVNVGAGLTAGMFFAEIRYHYMWGPTFTTPSGSQKATGKFLPLTVGVNF
jgi:opacity protein-like surface antigen